MTRARKGTVLAWSLDGVATVVEIIRVVIGDDHHAVSAVTAETVAVLARRAAEAVRASQQ